MDIEQRIQALEKQVELLKKGPSPLSRFLAFVGVIALVVLGVTGGASLLGSSLSSTFESIGEKLGSPDQP